MRTDNGRTTSLWMATAPEIEAAALAGDRNVDVCIVGAGIAGLSIAYHLAKSGKKVCVLDDGPIAGGESCRTTAHLTNAIDDRFYELEKLHGVEGSRLAAESHIAAIDRIEEIVREERIDCDFLRLDGYLFSFTGDEKELMQELEAAHRAGLTDVSMERTPAMRIHPGPALRFPRQGQFHLLKYLHGVARAIQRMGGELYSHTHAVTFQGGAGAQVITSTGHKVNCGSIVIATNVPVNDRVTIHTKQMGYRTYVIGMRVPKGSVPWALYWDTADPYHYIRLQRAEDEDADYDVLIVGGEDHKTGQANDTDQRFTCLEEWSRQRWPQMSAVDYRWSGQVAESDDYLGFIGRNPLDEPNVYIATGDSGMGMTHGTIAGMLISDLILGRPNPWEKLYDPSRIRLRSASEFLKENLNTAAEYKEWFTGGDVRSVEEIMPGEGAIVRRGLRKIAVYRGTDSSLRECSAVCPHLGGIVQWNSTEKTWDCPAHGSRFDTCGNVVNGPANGPLERLDEERKAA